MKINTKKIDMFIIFSFTLYSIYNTFINGYYTSIFMYPFYIWLLGVNVFHDACHFAF